MNKTRDRHIGPYLELSEDEEYVDDDGDIEDGEMANDEDVTLAISGSLNDNGSK